MKSSTPSASIHLKRSILFNLYHNLWQFMDWIYPPTCGGCETPGIRWCSSCQKNTIVIDKNKCCPCCGSPQRDNRLCANCREAPPPFIKLRSWGFYDNPLKNAIQQLKYKNDIGLAEAFCDNLLDVFLQMDCSVDFITAVPLSKERIQHRGYNQSTLLARPIALATGTPLRTAAVIRKQNTLSQVGLSMEERYANMEGAFQANQDIVKDKSILVIDDVTTTGATIKSCSRALLEAGASAIYCLTLAYAHHQKI